MMDLILIEADRVARLSSSDPDAERRRTPREPERILNAVVRDLREEDFSFAEILELVRIEGVSTSTKNLKVTDLEKRHGRIRQARLKRAAEEKARERMFSRNSELMRAIELKVAERDAKHKRR